MNPLNLYSLLLFFLLVLLLTGAYAYRRGFKTMHVLLLGGLVLGMAVLWYLIRPVQTPHADLDALRSQIGAGTPVLLEFQSPF